ncbi:MAG: hypothetical protein WCY30_00515 [Candidatus Neomarinimicrobiota bacterium]|jgi:hypothetical protein
MEEKVIKVSLIKRQYSRMPNQAITLRGDTLDNLVKADIEQIAKALHSLPKKTFVFDQGEFIMDMLSSPQPEYAADGSIKMYPNSNTPVHHQLSIKEQRMIFAIMDKIEESGALTNVKSMDVTVKEFSYEVHLPIDIAKYLAKRIIESCEHMVVPGRHFIDLFDIAKDIEAQAIKLETKL